MFVRYLNQQINKLGKYIIHVGWIYYLDVIEKFY